jgi:hypothetical protein
MVWSRAGQKLPLRQPEMKEDSSVDRGDGHAIRRRHESTPDQLPQNVDSASRGAFDR